MLYPLSYGGRSGPEKNVPVNASPASRAYPHRVRRSRRCTVAVAVVLAVGAAGCVKQAPPGPAEIRQTSPPWSAPRDGVSYIEAARMEQLPLDATANQRTVLLRVRIDGADVTVPRHVGVDRVRAVQAPAHTHDDSGTIFLEGDRGEPVTLGQFFTLWGVRLDQRCLGAACGDVALTVDGVRHRGDARDVRLAAAQVITVAVSSD